MLGLGEELDEVRVVFRDIRTTGCEGVPHARTLPPTDPEQLPVARFLHPDEFAESEPKRGCWGFPTSSPDR